jgi:hypothetical protein
MPGETEYMIIKHVHADFKDVNAADASRKAKYRRRSSTQCWA